jgi:hypothetical protein
MGIVDHEGLTRRRRRAADREVVAARRILAHTLIE